MFSIQDALEKNYPDFFSKESYLSQPTLAMLKLLTYEKEMQSFSDANPNCVGFDFVEKVLDYFNFSFVIRQNHKERIPARGRAIIVANHPIGSLDGLALIKMVSEIRSDVKVLATDVLKNIYALDPLMLPICSKKEHGYREKMACIREHIEVEGVLIVFPAGDVSRMGPTGIKDGRWRSTFLTLAEETHAPIVPIYIDARNSLFFYTLSLVSRPLSTLWLVRETFKHAENSAVIHIGESIDPTGYQDLNLPLKTKIKLFRKQVYRLPKGKPSMFKTVTPIAHPEDRQVLKRQIEQCELLGETRDNKKIYLYQHDSNSVILREMGRLREEAFRLIGEGTGNKRDVDTYDDYYYHIVLWDEKDLEIVGAYRLFPTSQAVEQNAKDQIYTSTLFEYKPETHAILRHGLELGRSFVQPKYWGSRSLDYLWYGISAFLQNHPQYRYLLGAVSISNSFSRPAKDLLVGYYQRFYGVESGNLTSTSDVTHEQKSLISELRSKYELVHCKRPYTLDESAKQKVAVLFDGLTAKEAFVVLKEQLGHMGYSVPTLYKQYTELCNPGGTVFLGFNIDPDFNDCVDGLVVVDANDLTALKRKRYGLLDHQFIENAPDLSLTQH